MNNRTSILDHAFIQHLNGVIEDHINDPDFDLKKLLRKAGISRTDLHRKLKRIRGMSASAYLRYIRLSKAAELLKSQPEWSIYQVALEVGFGSQSYFTLRFREFFGCCPVQFREQSCSLEHMLSEMEHTS